MEKDFIMKRVKMKLEDIKLKDCHGNDYVLSQISLNDILKNDVHNPKIIVADNYVWFIGEHDGQECRIDKNSFLKYFDVIGNVITLKIEYELVS